MDLLKNPALIPVKVCKILGKFKEDKEPVKELERIKYKLNNIGFTFDLGANNEPVNLRKMKQKEMFDFINETGGTFALYLLSDTVVKIGENKYKNQETQYSKTFTKSELKKWYKNEYKN